MNMKKVLILREASKIIMEINLVFREEMDMLTMEIGFINKEEIYLVTIGGSIMGIQIQDSILVMAILATEMEKWMATTVHISRVMANSLKMAILIVEIHTLGIIVLSLEGSYWNGNTSYKSAISPECKYVQEWATQHLFVTIELIKLHSRKIWE